MIFQTHVLLIFCCLKNLILYEYINFGHQSLTKEGVPCSLLIEPLQGETPSGYCQRLRQTGQWGSAAEIMALSVHLKRPITVHTRGSMRVKTDMRQVDDDDDDDDDDDGKKFTILQRFGVMEGEDGGEDGEDGEGVSVALIEERRKTAEQQKKRTLNILYTGNNHYSALVRLVEKEVPTTRSRL